MDLWEEPQENFFLATPFRLLDKLGNSFSASSSIANLMEHELLNLYGVYLKVICGCFKFKKAATRICKTP